MIEMPKKIYALPGWGFSASIFNEINEQKLNFFGIDYTGGQTSSIDEMTALIATKLPVNSILLGWSFGGILAIKLAAQYPTKVRQLILLSSQPKLCAEGEWMGIRQPDASQFIEQFEKSPKQQIEYFARLVCYPSRSPRLRQIIQKHLINDATKELTLHLKKLFREDLRKDYRTLNVDILHIIYGQDAVLPQSDNQLEKLNHRTQTIIFKHAGHADFLVPLSSSTALIKEFINCD